MWFAEDLKERNTSAASTVLKHLVVRAPRFELCTRRPSNRLLYMNWQATGQFPAYRPRRLRQSPALRRLVSETELSADHLVLPLFVRSGRRTRRPIAAMPGVFQLSPDEL